MKSGWFKPILLGLAGIMILFIGLPVCMDQISNAQANVWMNKLEALGYHAWVNAAGDIYISGDIIPTEDGTYNLGSVDSQLLAGWFNEVYINGEEVIPGGGGSSTFVDLTDTPADYSGEGGNWLKVNAGETGIEFVVGGAPGSFTGLSDTPANFTGSARLPARVNATETALEFAASGAEYVIAAINSSTYAKVKAIETGGIVCPAADAEAVLQPLINVADDNGTPLYFAAGSYPIDTTNLTVTTTIVGTGYVADFPINRGTIFVVAEGRQIVLHKNPSVGRLWNVGIQTTRAGSPLLVEASASGNYYQIGDILNNVYVEGYTGDRTGTGIEIKADATSFNEYVQLSSIGSIEISGFGKGLYLHAIEPANEGYVNGIHFESVIIVGCVYPIVLEGEGSSEVSGNIFMAINIQFSGGSTLEGIWLKRNARGNIFNVKFWDWGSVNKVRVDDTTSYGNHFRGNMDDLITDNGRLNVYEQTMPIRVLIVMETGGQFEELEDALGYAAGYADADDRWIIKVYGEITETATITCRSYVDVIGFNAVITSAQDPVVNLTTAGNFTWRNLDFHSTNATGSSVIDSLSTADETARFDSVRFYHDSIANNSLALHASSSCSPTFMDCEFYGGLTDGDDCYAIYLEGTCSPYFQGGRAESRSVNWAGYAIVFSSSGAFEFQNFYFKSIGTNSTVGMAAAVTAYKISNSTLEGGGDVINASVAGSIAQLFNCTLLGKIEKDVHGSLGDIQAISGWIQDSAQNLPLGTVPAGSYIMVAHCHVTEAFNSDGTDEITVGYDALVNAFATAIDVSSTGIKTVTLGAEGGYEGTTRAAEAYYVNGGSEPTTGKALIIIEFVRVPTSP